MRDAAFGLFAKAGFANVTVEEISAAAGVTERTFFRHFPTKEDVLFSDGEAIVQELIAAVRSVPSSANGMGMIRMAVKTLAASFDSDRDHHRLRSGIINGYPALHERELLKQHHIAAAIADELIARNVSRDRAMTMAGVGLVVFQVAYRSWTTDNTNLTLATRIERGLEHLGSDLGNQAVRPGEQQLPKPRTSS